MMSKKILLLSVFLMTAAVSGVPVPGYLVTGEKPSRLEVRAESELQLFWQKIFGRKLIKISEQQSRGKSVVYLGRTKYAEQNKINCSKLDEEEWVLKTSGDDLIIAGGRPAGVLYGVYEMLEQLGVEFLAFDETLIPAPCRKFPVFN